MIAQIGMSVITILVIMKPNQQETSAYLYSQIHTEVMERNV